ncbi:MAG: prepilin-type N-terminal cleavage/methylation domain-containing protein [Betaproteobacteria bacterium]|nr:prepilin-type N-terminal cleavage/methylation domain-containing protein [Betaproteobacteria bacterium]
MVKRTVQNRGFTLIELLVTLTIIATLLSLAAPRYFGGVERAKEAVLRENLVTLRDTLDKYFADTGHYPETLTELVSRKYMRRIPVDPITERADTWSFVAPPTSTTGGIYDVHSGAPGTARDGTPYASW